MAGGDLRQLEDSERRQDVEPQLALVQLDRPRAQVGPLLEPAAATRGGATEGIIFHGDRGSQYLSREYRALIDERGMVQSVGRTGVCWDNAVAEAAWSSLKRELVHRHVFPDRASARRAIFAWIHRYNTRRRHSTLGYIAPLEWEHQYRQPQATQAA